MKKTLFAFISFVLIFTLFGCTANSNYEETEPTLSDEEISLQQQEFVKSIINYVRENGDISREDLIEKAPFDNYDIITLFGENISSVLKIVSILHDSVNVAA